MAEHTQSPDASLPDDESVLALQNLKGDDDKPEVEAHDSTSSYVLCTIHEN
ncbi:hypothetical protein AB0M29_31955 [Streptomyces sp. NPDC051976]|uniref:hypothetical protein n=1 Tax=Streptomyces sp. NPDC051976 TaxID=3154947 RepID=UPI0034182B72